MDFSGPVYLKKWNKLFEHGDALVKFITIISIVGDVLEGGSQEMTMRWDRLV